MKKTSTFQNGLIWFGAGVSLAEILTGTAFAPLGMAKGFAAILLGHIIGCAMMLLAGLIGGRTGRTAMETVKMSFGQRGGLLFALPEQDAQGCLDELQQSVPEAKIVGYVTKKQEFSIYLE